MLQGKLQIWFVENTIIIIHVDTSCAIVFVSPELIQLKETLSGSVVRSNLALIAIFIVYHKNPTFYDLTQETKSYTYQNFLPAPSSIKCLVATITFKIVSCVNVISDYFFYDIFSRVWISQMLKWSLCRSYL